MNVNQHRSVEEVRAFEITHPDFNGGSMVLAAETEDDAASWVFALNKARTVTFENAQVGEALMNKMKAVGTQMEKQRQAALDRAQQEAEHLRREREEKEKLMYDKKELEKAKKEVDAIVDRLAEEIDEKNAQLHRSMASQLANTKVVQHAMRDAKDKSELLEKERSMRMVYESKAATVTEALQDERNVSADTISHTHMICPFLTFSVLSFARRSPQGAH